MNLSFSAAVSPAVLQAWLCALTPGADARDRLAEALAAGADVWGRAATVSARHAQGLTLPEAVAAGARAMGEREAWARLALLARHATSAQTPAQGAALDRVLAALVEQRAPLPLLQAWWGRRGDAPVDAEGLTVRALDRALAAGDGWAAQAVAWVHREVLAVDHWPAARVNAFETVEQPPALRDAYWALRRERPGTRRAPP